MAENTPNPGLDSSSSELRYISNEKIHQVGIQPNSVVSNDLESLQLTSTSYVPLDDVPKDYHPLDFKPVVLQTWFLVITTIFFLTCLGSILGILFSDHASQARLHIHAQRGFLALRYLPGIIGTITTMWWRSIGATLFHIMPYVSMAAPKPTSSQSKRSVLSSYQDFFFSTRLSTIRFLVRDNNWLMLSVILLQVVLALFIVPAKNVFVQLLPDENGWIVSVSHIAAGFLIAMYSLLIICTVTLAYWFWDRRTGLKWDPVCIADQIALIQGSNILESFQGLEFAPRWIARDVLGNSRGALRLGYWKKVDSGDIWHGIAFHAPLTDASEAPEPKTAIQITNQRNEDSNDSEEGPYYSSHEVPLDWGGSPIHHPETYRFRDVEQVHTNTTLTSYVLLGSGAIGALIFVITKGLVHRGFHFFSPIHIQLPPHSSIPIFDLEPVLKNFLFTFCPSFVMSLFSSLWIVTDNFYRTVQPIAAMYQPAPAEKTILLDYLRCPAIIAIPKAALNEHWRVSWFSLLALSANAGPIIAAGIFVSVPSEEGFLMKVSPVNLFFILSLLVIYLVSLPFARPRPKHRLPRQILTIADLICYCYASNLVNDKMFSVQKPDDEQIHLVSQVYLGKKLYEFGLYKGTDGRRHIGMDIVDPLNPIDICDPGSSFHIFGCHMWFRRRRVVKRNVA